MELKSEFVYWHFGIEYVQETSNVRKNDASWKTFCCRECITENEWHREGAVEYRALE